ncbi:hypothetical protein [Aurantimonas marina]|uniref:hypothetical protein n=1 Tax=Aurantimonas marina TaxID=2780508 RepID=UPI0019D12868|nr:hypothetical protein [Aurantimonas marina]
MIGDNALGVHRKFTRGIGRDLEVLKSVCVMAEHDEIANCDTAQPDSLDSDEWAVDRGKEIFRSEFLVRPQMVADGRIETHGLDGQAIDGKLSTKERAQTDAGTHAAGGSNCPTGSPILDHDVGKADTESSRRTESDLLATEFDPKVRPDERRGDPFDLPTQQVFASIGPQQCADGNADRQDNEYGETAQPRANPNRCFHGPITRAPNAARTVSMPSHAKRCSFSLLKMRRGRHGCSNTIEILIKNFGSKGSQNIPRLISQAPDLKRTT